MMTTRDIVESIISIMYQAAVEYRLKSMSNSILSISAPKEQCKRILQEQCRMEKQYRDRITLLYIAIEMVENGLY